MKISRRSLLFGSAALAGAAVPFNRLFRRSEPGNVGRFGVLRPDPAGILDLPEGFSYRVLQRKGAVMSDGYVVPGAFDGMGCFPGPAGTLVLMRNHELETIGVPSPYRAGQRPPEEAYDVSSIGGVSRLVVDEQTLEVRSSNLALIGTRRNCAGGSSPWGWLSCEETMDANHGYVFLCSVDAERVTPPKRLDGYGRFRHEAACVDPRTHVAYLTEDQGDSCLYRFVPRVASRPFEGSLQAMALRQYPGLDTGRDAERGVRYDVEWVDIEDPTPADDAVRFQGHQRGAALIRRGEGMGLDGDELWFVATTGGPQDAGQIFRLTIGRDGGPDTLELIGQSERADSLDMPDNLTVAPWGEVFLAEDAVGGDQYLRVLNREGQVVDFARNALSQSELAGVCFSPSGRTLFVNIYGDGLTLAVQGPFQSA